jgi:arylsulfatase A-like enzyme
MKMRLLVPSLIALASLGFAADPLPSRNGQPPNILVFLADDLGQRDLVCYSGSSFYETPHLDRLAATGVRFTDGYAANPVCSPTRYALLTGKWPTRAGLTNWLTGLREERFRGAPLARQMPAEEITLAEVLRGAGYRTAFVGKWHLGEEERFWPEQQGFEVNVGGWSRGQPNSWFSPYRNPRLADGLEGEFLTDRLAEETVALLRQYKESGEPFLLCHFFYQVHTPLRAPAHLVEKYKQKAVRLGLQDEFGDEHQYFISAKKPRRVRQSQSLPVYAAMVEAMDTAAGRVLAALDQLGLAENTLVIFTSDNGGLSTSEGAPTSNLPFRGGKGWLYEGGLRVPLLVRWPGVAREGSVVDSPATTLDLFPTVLAAAGIAPPEGVPVDGLDLRPALEGNAMPSRDLFWHYPHYGNQGGFPGGAIRSGQWKLLENYEDGSVRLHHLASDPGERVNLEARDPERVRDLRTRLHAWYRDTGAQFLRAKEVGPDPWAPPVNRSP